MWSDSGKSTNRLRFPKFHFTNREVPADDESVVEGLSKLVAQLGTKHHELTQAITDLLQKQRDEIEKVRRAVHDTQVAKAKKLRAQNRKLRKSFPSASPALTLNVSGPVGDETVLHEIQPQGHGE